MQKKLLRLCSLVLTIAMLCNMLPLTTLAASGELQAESNSNAVKPSGTVESVVTEVIDKRTEYSKDFKLSSGFHLATLYSEPVHYWKDGQWQEIDNTLKLEGIGTNARYTNTAGIWDVSFPQQFGSGDAVTVTKDGKTLSFRMTGALRLGDHAVASAQTESYALSTAQTSTARIETVDMTKEKASAQYPETVYEKGHSRLRYDSVFSGTHVVYDLQGNQVKESVVMESYDPQLRGYRFLLETEGLIPVLSEDGQILLYGTGKDEVVMAMPAPFLLDAAGVSNYDVTVSLTPGEGGYILSYILPTQWLASEQRQWPVVLDPVVVPTLSTGNIKDATVCSNGGQESYLDGSIEVGWDDDDGIRRFFLKYKTLPKLTSSDVIVEARIYLEKCITSASDRVVTVHRLHKTWESDTVTWANYFGSSSATETYHDLKATDYQTVKNAGTYDWEITDIVRDWYENKNTGMLFKALYETSNVSMGQFYSSDYSATPEHMPVLSIIYRNNNGLEDYWDFTASSAGRAGTGYINNYTGNLVWIRNDLGFGGNRMPVSISHIYNANDAAKNNFGLGYGWRTNYHQSVKAITAANTNASYVWEDGDGTAHYFIYDSSKGKYIDEDGLDLTLTATGSGTTKYCISDKNGNCSYFDANGRLTKLENNQATKSSINITYTSSSSKLISKITDGVGRAYNFTYSSSLLTQISYTGSGTTTLSYVKFGYSSSKLTSVTDKDGKISYYTYSSNNHLLSAKDIDGYLLTYTYTSTAGDNPARVASVAETHNSASGGTLSIEYAHNQTTFTDVSGNVQIVQFNNWGNTVSIQDGEGRAQYATYATDANSSAKGNQLNLASKLQNTVGNVLNNSSFEGTAVWSTTGDGVSISFAFGTAYHGNKSLKLTKSSAETLGGVYSSSFAVGAGETYTFSAYVQTENGMTAYLAISEGSTVLSKCDPLAANSGWTRLQVSYTNTGSSSKTVTARVLTTAAGTAYIDCVQVEKAPTASRYNLVENGDFRNSTTWSASSGRTTASPAAAPQLSTNVYQFTGNPTGTNRISQTVKISGNEGDTLVLAGWAKGDSAPLRDNREFSIIATFLNSSGSSLGSDKVTFNPDNNSSVAWQYAAAAIVAPAAYSSVKIELAYDYNINTVYFDGIQLYKEEFGTSYTYDANGNVISVEDLQKQTTTYQYTNNNLTKQTLPTGAALTYTYDNYHNVLTAKSATGVNYSFSYDSFGNSTSVSIISGSVKLVSSAIYTTDGNSLTSTTDAAGKVTTYSYNANTGVLEWVQYPEDTAATRTEYTYDNMYRLAKTEADVNTGSTLTASYGYTNDLLTSITTGSTTYSFAYGNFALRSNIKIGTRTLASYAYTSRTNYLSSLDYGNGDSVDYTYDKQGRVTKQTYEDGDTVTYKYDNNGALASVTDSATGITTTYYYDFTDRLMKHVENGSGYSHSVGYEYDNINNLTSLVETINGVKHSTAYTYDTDNRISTVTNGNASETYTYDAYSRLSKRVAKNGTATVLTDTLTYRTPTSATTSGQIASLKSVAAGYNVTYNYTYDDNGNILSVSTGTNKTTSYVYDSANQLIRENNQAENKTWIWTYDDAGNILSKKEYAYTTAANPTGTPKEVTYGYDATWGDLLKTWNGKTISSDTIGNMTSDGTWIYTWEHGRELASMANGSTTWSFTYNADGLRTKRTNGSTTYSYVYNGSSLSQMTVGGNTLYFAYDASGTPMSVTYNGTNYYYATNIQGDVTAILNTSGTAVVQYTYDAWGKLLSTTNTTDAANLATLNPLRYRGYVYDTEAQLYYLQSRYYNPAMGRFINGDEVTNLGADDGLTSFNLFTYCTNNPVNRFDENGNWSLPNWAKIAIGVGIIVAAAAVTVATGGAAAGTLVAAVHCAAQGALVGAVTQGAIGAVTGGISGAVTHRLTTGSWSGAANAAIDGAASGFMTGTITGAISGAISSPYCFVAGTTVLTAAGVAAIETIQKGDRVWAWDEETGDIALKEVVETYVNETDELVHVFVNGEEIVATPSHPFYSPVKGWTDAVQLRAGDILVLVNGEYVVVEKVQHEILEAPVTVYNFQVEDYHTYYVASGVLVHNSCAHKSSSWRSTKQNYWKQQAAKGGNDTWYELTDENLALMAKGKAPWGRDGERVVLHHIEGIANSMDNIVEIGAKAHRAFHGAFGYKDFIDIFLI